MENWTKIIVLSVGGSLGVNARYWLGVWINRWASPEFPWATVSINVSGSLLIGFLTVVLTRWMPHPNIRLMVITGFLGGYTTFSTFTNDALTLWERGAGILVAANVIGSVTAGFGAVVLGTALARGLAEPASQQPADVSRRIEPMAAEHTHPAQTQVDQAISANANAAGAAGGQSGANEASR